jgi:hypothetical protein
MEILFFLVKRIDVLNNVLETININLKNHVESEVIKAVTGIDVIYFGIEVSKEPASSE